MHIVITLIILVAGWFGYHRWSRHRARKTLLASPLTDQERTIIADQIPLIRRLPPDLNAKLEGRINLFLDQVTFVGCDGLDVTDDMQLSIAAQACLLVMNTDQWYKHLRTILIYPGAFQSLQTSHDGYVVREHKQIRLGESWAYGPVILSWADTYQGGINDEDGRNLVLHEFAHQLDQLSGHTNGAPVLNRGQSFADWERTILEAYDRHVQATETGRTTVIDPYGATGHEEFFAVAIELFFEKPAALQQDEPQVYQQLSDLLQLDPLTWPQN
ncbi:zinc-dependent peptidase [Pseudaestuariivita rosea]|uniref:M90 family metallopeptidase n=1 Tax=Pseudaestuariivita rosea TaxID=2763263 RepID=UPI001ABA5009|nr:M90 family metallopeptidase [Pseudaestuariivita rosea]